MNVDKVRGTGLCALQRQIGQFNYYCELQFRSVACDILQEIVANQQRSEPKTYTASRAILKIFIDFVGRIVFQLDTVYEMSLNQFIRFIIRPLRAIY